MPRIAAALALVLPITALLCAQDPGVDKTARLRYAVTTAGDAAPVALASPGHSSQHALRLGCELTSWARWNLPIFQPVPGLERVTFWARRNGDLPPALTVRLLEQDGSEWQSRPRDLTPEWRAYMLRADDFQYFRSRDSRKGTPVRMANVIQVQFVPSSSKKGRLEFQLDDVSLEPGGPRCRFEEDEQQKPMSAQDAATARYAFLHGVNEAMLRQADAEIEYARRSIADARSLLDAKKPDETFDDLVRKHGDKVRERAFAFQQQPPRLGQFISSRDGAGSAAQLEDIARRFHTPPRPLCEFRESDAGKWRSTKLYQAKAPAPPAWRKGEEGRGAIEQHVVFSADNSRQVIFLTLALDELIDLRERYDTIAFRYRITSSKIHPKEGVRVRLYSKAPQESWMDDVAILPDGIAPGEWVERRLSLLSFSRNAHFDPSKLTAVAFRIENQPGEAAEFDFSVSSVELRCERPYELAIDRAQKENRERLTKKRFDLLKLYDDLLGLKRRMAPELLRFYLWSQLTNGARAREIASQRPSDAMARAAGKEAKGSLLPVVQATAVPEGAAGRLHAEIRYVGGGPMPSRIEAALFDHADRCVYSSVVDGAGEQLKQGAIHLSSTLSGLQYWWPGYPYLYTLKVGAFDGDKLVDVAVRRIGFAKVECRQGDVTGAMRHARRLSARDYSIWINGQPHFSIGTHAGLGGLDNPRDFASLLQDLWLEFQRNYGFRPTSDLWDVFDEEGLMYTCPIHPPYSAIRSCEDVEAVIRDYETRLTMAEAGLHHPSIVHYAIGNEAELPIWGADLAATFGNEIWQPMEQAARIVKRKVGDGAPVCYIRATHFSRVPGIPSEDMSGVNQYTGRYGGRIEQVPWALRVLTLNSALHGWPIMITEWNGPKYTWATTGIGGSSEHGCAYYIHKYWDSMVRTNAIVGSSEFTLNWICTPIEDLTTVSIEEGMKRRPKYSPFGGGYTAGHVPYMWPGNIAKCDTYRYMQAFQSPLYFLVNAPGKLLVLHVPAAAEQATSLVGILRDLGKPIEAQELRPEHDLAKLDADILLFGSIGAEQPVQIKDLDARLIIGKTLNDFPRANMPLIQKRVNPFHPQRSVVVVTASAKAGYDIGMERLLESARTLRRIRREEGAMTRLLIFAEPKAQKVYQEYFNEFATRGFFHGFDDFRTEIRKDDILGADGKLLQRFWNLTAAVLDLERELSPDEFETLKALSRLGVNVVASLPCYERNPRLRELLGVTTGRSFSLAESILVEEAFQKPLSVSDLGHAQLDRVMKFANINEAEARRRLQIKQVNGEGAVPIARMRETGEPVAVAVNRDGGRWFVVGCALRELFETHSLVTRRGETHPLYDRGTACGLERLSRLVVNMCRAGAVAEKDLHVIHGTIETSASALGKGEPVRLRLRLTDEQDQPVVGATVLAMAQYIPDCLAGARRPDGETFCIAESDSDRGSYELCVALADDKHSPSEPGSAPLKDMFIARPKEAGALGEAAISIGLKAIKRDHLLYEDAAAVFVSP